jgi:small subunit ribosomal protein S6
VTLASTVYEGMFILDSGRYGREPDAVAGQIQEIIEKAGGEILVHRLWDERRLAFPIKGQRKGTYWLTYFRLDSSQLSAVRRQYRLNENVLRMLLLKVEPRIVDALVEHARSATFAPPADIAAEPAGEPVRDPVLAALGVDELDIPAADEDIEEE